MTDITIELASSIDDINEIQSWSEYWDSSCSTILQAFKNKELIVAKYDNKIVSYYAYRKKSITIFISLVETKTNFRKKGIAKKILEKLLENYKNTNFKAFYLYCSPKESQFYWKKVGFEYFPENKLESKIYMHKIFGEVMPLINDNEKRPKNYIEFWNKDLPRKDENPKWFSELIFKENTNELIKPILFFGKDKWYINIVKDNLSNKLRFKDYDRKYKYHECIYITEIK